MGECSAEMPKYKCHKEVWALKIAAIKKDGEGEDRETDGSAMLTPENTRYAPFRVDSAWLRRNPKTEVGGYFVVYPMMQGESEAYTAYSPADAFEAGYTLI